MKTVNATSLWVAALRALESERPDRVFADPYARLLAGDEYDRVDTLLGPVPGRELNPLVMRTCFGDAILRREVANGTRQVVVLGAGMDTRAYRLDLPADLALFEVDVPPVFDYKHRVLGEAGALPSCRRIGVAADLAEDWPSALLGAGFAPGEPTLWFVEGVLLYLPPAQVEALGEQVTALTGASGVAVFDAYPEELFADAVMGGWNESLRDGQGAEGGGAAPFAMSEPASWLTRRGWRAGAYTSDDVRAGRCPWLRGVPERVTALFPAGWVVRAEYRQPAGNGRG
jgi:methyltransferase (TIGR00027 family)